MAVDEDFLARVRAVLEDTPGVVEKRMFGGVGFLIGGHMATGIHTDGRLMIRCSRQDFAALSARPGAAPMMRGSKPLTGWVLVDRSAVGAEAELRAWTAFGVAHAASQPPKAPKAPRSVRSA